jgi:hypothetical protein
MMARTLIADLVDELERGRFFGSLELKFEAGQVVLLRKTETIKPAKGAYRNTRGVEGVGNGK